MNQRNFIEFGSIENIYNILKEFSAKRIFLVTDKNSYMLSGAQAKLKHLEEENTVFIFSEFDLNPKIEDVLNGIKSFNLFQPDVVIAIGGGSAIDMAKLIKFFAGNNIVPKDFIDGKISDLQNGKPLIALPTTAGTGSEATHFAVLYINHIKYSIAHAFILPDIVIIDPDLTMSLPSKISAYSGMDALSQAIESYWSIYSTAESKKYAAEAIPLIAENIVKAVNNPDRESRMALAKSAYLAGKAINITKTTAPHAVSYPITAYFGVPHGHAVALTLPSFFEYNANVTDDDFLDKRGVNYVKLSLMEIAQFLNTEDVISAKEKLENIMDDIALERNLSPLGIKGKKEIEVIVKNGFNPQRVKNNPRKLTEAHLKKILYQLL